MRILNSFSHLFERDNLLIAGRKMKSYGRKFITRALVLLVVFLVAYTIGFALAHATGDPFAQEKEKSPDAWLVDEKSFYLDRSWLEQYFIALGKLFSSFDFGNSAISRTTSVIDYAQARPFYSLTVGLIGFIISLLIGVPLGIWSALKKGKAADIIISAFVTILIAVPSFVLILVLMGIISPYVDPVFNGTFLSFVIMGIAVGVPGSALYARYIRTAMIAELNMKYIDFAMTKGLSKLQIIARHVARPAMIPIVTFIPYILTSMLLGSILVETSFLMPGLGSLLRDSFQKSDFNVIIFIVVLSNLVMIGGFILRDILYPLVDPRIRGS